ncbi:pirin family protein [Shewanella psychrotolerans]|uniref:pirin family protein n=1 Tax=Shewanella psychrotolerans TaxID=2864206 RepID=UPI001C65DB6F|nr:pirin family protein [Shewanella psychrotolerans]QYK02047.1 pirin family protein [Shewanella psychrotolerans]
MKVLSQFSARPAMDGDGVNIRRVADFQNTKFDPFLMLDEIKSDDEQDFIGGFPPHPHRGIETFTYIRKGGFEHRDQLGNVKAIRATDVQWMSTGSGVVHSEMPLADATDGLHGFQIWLNMPAKDKMRPAIYKDSTDTRNPEISNSDGAVLRALAGDWQFAGENTINAPVQGLAGQGMVADLMLNQNARAKIDLSHRQYAGVYLYQGSLINTEQNETKQYREGQYLIVDSQTLLSLQAGAQGAGALIFAGDPINEEIVHMGPFVMNTQAEIRQAIEDYQAGRFGAI